MKRNLILTLSSDTGFGMQLAEIILKEIDGVSLIMDIRKAAGNINDVTHYIEHQLVDEARYFFVMPEFNGSYPAAFKEFIDNYGWPNKLKGKSVCLVGYSGGWSGNVMGVNHIKAVLDYIDADVCRHSAHFTYNGKRSDIYDKELEILKQILKQYHNE